MRISLLVLPVIYSTDPVTSSMGDNSSIIGVSSNSADATAVTTSSTSSAETSEHPLEVTPAENREGEHSGAVVLTEKEERRKMVYQAALARMQRFQGSTKRAVSPPVSGIRTYTTTYGIGAPSISLDPMAGFKLANKGPGHRGLPNLGMTCFMNSAMQVLMNAGTVRSIASDVNTTFMEEAAAAASSSSGWKRAEKLRVAKSFADLTNMYWSGDNTTTVDLSIPMRAFVTSLNNLDPDIFVRGRMGDSHEVIKAVLDAFPLAASGDRYNPLESLFQTIGEEKRKMCMACERYDGPPTYEPLQEMIMKTELVGRAQSVNLQEYVTALLSNSINETIDGVECSACSSNGSAVRQTVRLESSTVVRGNGSLLLVPLPRFQMGSMLKNTVSVEIPLELTLSETTRPFKLAGIVYHAGSTLNFGHYTASFVDQVDGKWYHANDGVVREIVTPVLTGETPYLLMYQRSD